MEILHQGLSSDRVCFELPKYHTDCLYAGDSWSLALLLCVQIAHLEVVCWDLAEYLPKGFFTHRLTSQLQLIWIIFFEFKANLS